MSKEFILCGKSAPGKKHVSKGALCQDAVFCVEDQFGVYAIIAADGVGSCKYGREAALIAVNTARNLIPHNFQRWQSMNANEVKFEIVETIKGETFKQHHGVDADEWASTLLFAATDGNHILAFQCGDGAIVLVKNGEAREVCQTIRYDQRGATNIIQSRKLIDDMNIGKGEVEGFEGFVLMTNGVEKLMKIGMPNGILATSQNIVNEIIKATNPRATFEDVIDQIYPYVVDDCTLAVMTLKKGTESPKKWFEL